MPRKAPIRKKKKTISKKIKVPQHIIEPKIISTGTSTVCVDGKCETVEVKLISIECMHKCGTMIQTLVNASDIIPHLGRPRGLRLRCHHCNYKYNNHGMIPNTEGFAL